MTRLTDGRYNRFEHTRLNAPGFRGLLGLSGSAVDTTAPTLANLVVDDTVSPVTVTYDLTEDSGSADVHWVLVANGATAPTATEISNGQASGGGSPADSGTFASQVPGSGVGDTTTFATGLDGSYDIYLVAEDAAPNLSNVVSDTALSIDTTAPISTITGVTAGSGALSIDWTTDTGAGTGRIVVVPNGGTAPIAPEILAGQESGGAAADGDSGNITVSGTGAQTTVVITGLTNGTAYDVYLAHEDAAIDPNAVTDASTNHTPVAPPTFISLVHEEPKFEHRSASDKVLTNVNLGAAGVIAVAIMGFRNDPAGGPGIPNSVTIDGEVGTDAAPLITPTEPSIRGGVCKIFEVAWDGGTGGVAANVTIGFDDTAHDMRVDFFNLASATATAHDTGGGYDLGGVGDPPVVSADVDTVAGGGVIAIAATESGSSTISITGVTNNTPAQSGTAANNPYSVSGQIDTASAETPRTISATGNLVDSGDLAALAVSFTT